MHQLLEFIFGIKLYIFRTVRLSVTRSFSLYTQQRYKSYRFADSFQAGSGWNCPKYVQFYSKNKFENLVHVVGFIISIIIIIIIITITITIIIIIIIIITNLGT